MQQKQFLILPLLLTLACLGACRKNTDTPPVPTSTSYKKDGRSVKASDVDPIAVDINQDGQVDYTVFVQLMANSEGDHLYAGINPIGGNLIKSGPANDEHFLNMGFLHAETLYAPINGTLSGDLRWTDEHSTLCIRHTKSNHSVWYEGDWGNAQPQVVGIQYAENGKFYYGWMRLQFDKKQETITLIDFAYALKEATAIPAGYP